ncbi:hypothetical protein FY553_14025 [Vibrio cholerae]|nr:hypothetical protein FY553_14025 [Vibrio cholerae]
MLFRQLAAGVKRFGGIARLRRLYNVHVSLLRMMSFEMTLRYLTDTQQETTCCLNHFQKFFDNPT